METKSQKSATRAVALASAIASLALACEPTEPEPADAGAEDVGAAPDVDVDAGADAGEDVDAGAPAPDPRQFEDCAPYSVEGPYPAGVTTVEIDGSPVEVWYPATPGSEEGREREVYDLRDWLAPEDAALIDPEDPTRYTTSAWRGLERAALDAPAPLVVFSHGFAGYRMQSTFLTAHLATWGFVVAAVEHPERGLAAVLDGNLGGAGSDADVDAVAGAIAHLTSSESDFAGAIDADRVGVVGHSAGGATSLAAVAPERALGIDAVVGLAPAVQGFDGSESPAVNVPLSVIIGETDAVTTAGPIEEYYAAQEVAPRTFASLASAGHLAFSDICLIGRERGGIARIARERGLSVPVFVLRLAQDGCRDSDMDPRVAFPIVNHLTTSHFREVLMGEEATGEDEACFGENLEAFERVSQ